jgi:ribonuclease BN (tRNA processing enzyme)
MRVKGPVCVFTPTPALDMTGPTAYYLMAMGLELIPLGINGYYPAAGRQTACYLVLTPRQALLLDAGTGLGRLGEPAIRRRLAGYRRLDIILSHYHLDHVIGLFQLPSLWADRPVRLYAPARPLLPVSPAAALDRLFGPPFATNLKRLANRLAIIPIRRNTLRIGAVDFRFWKQRHPGGSLGMRLDDDLVYATDRAMELADARHARGARLLLHELWLTDAEARADPDGLAMHSSVGQVAAFARAAGVGALMPIHFKPTRTGAGIESMIQILRLRAGCPILRPREGHRYSI